MSYFKETNRRSSMTRNITNISTNNVPHRERLIKISQFLEQNSEDIGAIKDGLQDAGEHLSEIHLTVQTNQQRMEAQAAQNQSALYLMMEDYQDRIENQFSRLEIEEQSKILHSLARIG
jgi:archaellum component FlaC